MQAGAANFVFLDQCDPHAKLGGAQSAGVAPGSAAKDYDMGPDTHRLILGLLDA